MIKRLFFYPALFLFLLSSAILSAQSVAETPVSKLDTEWWKARHEEKVALAKEGNVDIVFLGDSITHGWERPAGEAIRKKYYDDRNVLNLGFGADRTEHVLWRIQNGEIDGIQPKLLVLMIGTNNIGHRTSTPAETVAGIKAILDELVARLPQTKIILHPIFPRGATPGDELRQKTAEVNKSLPALADGERILYVDFNDQYLTTDGILTREIMPDLLHPNATGYITWAEALEPFIQKYVYPSTTLPAEKMTLDWWKTRHEKKAALARGGNIDFVLIGDSITHGWEGSGKNIFAQYYEPRRALNIGFGGDRTQHVVWRLQNGEIDGIAPKAAMIMIGTNNLHSNSVQEIVEGNKAIIRTLREKLPETKIILLGIFPRGDDAASPDRKKVGEINAKLQKLADGETIFYLSFNEKLVAENGNMVGEIMPDKVHLSEAGYRIWAESCEPLVKKLVDAPAE
ncbi:MAG: GDSL-type esterase/lipase family protein [Planctomycetia bacterium]|nr:GDSL-type esterase/lipase family protein [Planctomycetia bacterium]